MDRDVAHEIARGTMLRHALDAGARDGADAILERRHSLLGEPGLGDGAVFGIIRLVHVNEGADRMRAATRHRPGHVVGGARHERMRAIAAVEEIVPTDDVCDIRVPRHHPERIEVRGIRPGRRVSSRAASAVRQAATVVSRKLSAK